MEIILGLVLFSEFSELCKEALIIQSSYNKPEQVH